MIKKLSESISLLWNDLGLLASIVLTVWLPGNILSNVIAYQFPDVSPLSQVRLMLGIETIFGPLCSAGLIQVLYRRKRGEAVSYKEAMTFAVRKWWPLFAANLAAGIRIVLGFLDRKS